MSTLQPDIFLIRWGKRVYDLPYLILPLAPLFWSGNFILGRAVRASLPPIGLAFWRWCIASVIITGIAWPYLKKDRPVIRQHWKIILCLSTIGIACFNTLVYSGLQFTSAINGVLIQSALPVFIVIQSFLFFREKIRLIQCLGIFVSLCGALMIITQGDLTVLTGLSFNVGDLLILIAVICYAAYSAFLRKRPQLHPFSFLAATFSAGTVVLLPLYLWEHFMRQTMPVTPVTFFSVGYVAIFPSILAYLCFNRGVELLGANRAGLFIHLMPVFGSIMAIVFLGEQLKPYHALGIVLILSGILLATQVLSRPR